LCRIDLLLMQACLVCRNAHGLVRRRTPAGSEGVQEFLADLLLPFQNAKTFYSTSKFGDV
jgi:hypothetical protein